MNRQVVRWIALLMIPAIFGHLPALAPATASRYPSPSFSIEALAVEPAAGRFTPILQESPRFQTLQSVSGSVRRDPQLQDTILPEDSPQELDERYHKYLAEPDQLKATLRDLVANQKSLVIKESIAPKAFDDEGNAQPQNLLGVLATPSEPLKMELARLQKEMLGFFKKAVQAEVAPEHVEAAYKDLLTNFVWPTFPHLTFAGFKVDPTDNVASRDFDHREWQPLLRRTEEISRFRQEMTFEFDDQVILLPTETAGIAALLKPKTREDLKRFLGIRINYGNRKPARTALAHLSLIYLRGIKDPVSGDYIVNADHLRWIERGLILREAAAANARAEHRTNTLEWSIKQLEPTVSTDVNTPIKIKVYPLLTSMQYREWIERGKERLAEAWDDLSGPQDLDGKTLVSAAILSRLDAVLGLFPRQHLRNLRALFAAIGAGEISVHEMMEFILHGQRVNSRVRRSAEGELSLRITALHDRPGLLLAISRVLDQSGGYVKQITQTDGHRTGDPLTIDIKMDPKTITESELINLALQIGQIPDMGRSVHAGRFLPAVFLDWWSPKVDQVEITLHAALPRKNRQAGVASQRTLMLDALKKLDPHASVMQLELIGDPEGTGQGSQMTMTIHIGPEWAGMAPAQLSLSIDVTNAVKEIDDRMTVTVMANQKNLLSHAPAVQDSYLPKGTILQSKLQAREETLKREHFEKLKPIDITRVIERDLEEIPLSAEMSRRYWNENVEEPAQELVHKILQLNGTILRVNAFGHGWKGVFWDYDGEKYFTPLSLSDYDVTPELDRRSSKGAVLLEVPPRGSRQAA